MCLESKRSTFRMAKLFCEYISIDVDIFHDTCVVFRISLSVEHVACWSPSAVALNAQGCVTKDMTASKS